MKDVAGRPGSTRDSIRSKKRVADHGEVFTPSWLVEAMLDLTEESDRIDARVLEPACGNGNFLIRILQRKLAIVEVTSRSSSADKMLLALVSIMSIYGIELLRDNVNECRQGLMRVFADYLKIGPSHEFYRAASRVLSLNIVHGDALKMITSSNRPIVFPEWTYLGKGKFQRKDFRYDLLAQGARAVIFPMNTHKQMTVREIASNAGSRAREVTL